MVVRLILVGLVAGLGLSLPSRGDLDALGRSAQRWANARLAEWDAGTSIEEGSFVLITEPILPPSQPAVVDGSVSDHDFMVVMDEMVATLAQDELASRGGETAEPVAGIAERLAASAAAETLAIASPTEPAAVEPERMDVAFAAVMEETVAAFAADLADIDRQDAVDALAFQGWAEEMVRFMTIEPSVASEEAETPAYEPLEVDENLYPGEAYALSQRSETGAEAASAAREEMRLSESRLTHAVRLTREAVVAWAGLLHGPAVVTIAP